MLLNKIKKQQKNYYPRYYIFQLLPKISMDTHFKSIKKNEIDYFVKPNLKMLR